MEGAAVLQHERASLERAHERTPLGVQFTCLREQVVAREVRARAGGRASARGAGVRAADPRGRGGRGGGRRGRRGPRETLRDGRDAVDILEHTLNSEMKESQHSVQV